eukprot:7634778-Pyramimonas_sp.AAC.1
MNVSLDIALGRQEAEPTHQRCSSETLLSSPNTGREYCEVSTASCQYDVAVMISDKHEAALAQVMRTAAGVAV